MAHPASPGVTGDELSRHRLDQFEDWRTQAAANLQSTMRDVDLQKLETATVKSLLIEVRTEMRSNDEHTRASLARLHERLDEVVRDDTREAGRTEGRQEASTRTWKVVFSTVMACAAVAAVVVAVLTLVLRHG